MSKENEFLEENTARLIRSALGADARPPFVAKERVLRRLLAEQRARLERAEFPDSVLAALVGLLAVVGVWLTAQRLGPGLPAASSLPLTIAMWLVCVNLSAIPVAGIIIVIRRRKCQNAQSEYSR